MGAEQSAEKKKIQDEEKQKTVQEIQRQQRLMYEKRCREMLKQQVKIQVYEGIEEKTLQNTNPIYTPLYPNLQVPQSFNVQPSTSTSYNTNTTKNIQMNMQTNASVSPNYNAAYNSQPSAPPFGSKTSPAPRASHPPSAPTASTSKAVSEMRPRQKNYYNNAMKQNISDVKKCSTCGDSLGVKIYQCGLGHSSCMVCKFKESYCGICRNPISDTRNIDVEKYLADLQLNPVEKVINCPNKIDGCRLSFKESMFEPHLKECPFREMACPVAFLYNGCTWRGKINQIQAHFLDCHPNQTGADVDTEMSFNPGSKEHIVYHVAMGNFHFLVHLKTDSDFVYCSVQLIGSRISAAKWSYELHLYNKSEPRRKYMYSDICIPNIDSFTDICKESNCAVFPLRYAISFINDSKLTYKFYIKKGNDREIKCTDGQNQRARRSHQNHNKKYNNNNNNRS